MKENFDKFLTYNSVDISFSTFFINLIICLLYIYILRIIYNNYGTSISNRKQFSKNFFTISLTTLFIITVIKHSLALSLGLVGALSIVRFRTAIKDPEELAALFFSIAIGIGLGANQVAITTLSFIVISLLLIINGKFFSKTEVDNGVYLNIISDNIKSFSYKNIVNVLDKYCYQIKLKNLIESKNNYDLSFEIEFKNDGNIEFVKEELKVLDTEMIISIHSTSS